MAPSHLAEIPIATPATVDVAVRHGMVTLAGTAEPGSGGPAVLTISFRSR
jgi:hypothetical protein